MLHISLIKRKRVFFAFNHHSNDEFIKINTFFFVAEIFPQANFCYSFDYIWGRFAPTFDIEIDFCSPEKACDLLFDELIDIFERNFM